MHLLRLDEHYVLIYNMSAFLQQPGSRLGRLQVPSPPRLSPVPLWLPVRRTTWRGTSRNLAASTLASAKRFCAWPDVSKRQHLVRYKPGPSAEFCPLVVYSDLEAFSDPVPQAAEDLHSVQRRVASLAFRAVTRNGFELPTGEMVYLTRAEAGESEHAVVERYLRFLLRVGKRYLLWKKTTNVPARPTAAEWRGSTRPLPSAPDATRPSSKGALAKGRSSTTDTGPVSTSRPFAAPATALSSRRAKCQSSSTTAATTTSSSSFARSPSCGARLSRRTPDSGRTSCRDADSDEELEPLDSTASLELDEEVDFKKLHFSVLFKTSEKMLQVKLGNLVFRDSINFYNSGLDKLMDNLAKTAPDGNLAAVFPHVAATHPEPAA